MPQGSCLCGDVAYRINGPLAEAHHCHCGFCRKEHGTPYATYAMAQAADLEWLRGKDKLLRYESSPGFHRCFCGRCGSTMPGDEFQGLVFIPLGNIDGDPGVVPSSHIFAGSKAPWWNINDGLLQYDAFPDGVDAPVHPARVPVDAPGRPRGSCLCGRVAFVINGEPVRAANCYCGRCRKARSAGHASNMFVRLGDLRFTRGQGELRQYKVPDARYFAQVFCGHCGSAMPRSDEGRDLAVIPLGSMDDDPPMLPQMHIFVSDKAAWIGIFDELPQFAEGPPA
ncbi:MAG TPA: GFA family protein [Candidatus Limnocylindrales bacterium]|jgi:hypothetical protein|nr:GFA family protein [Candidatus Limnocylindrales bacterium]